MFALPNRATLLVGVALCATPIFTYAQANSQVSEASRMFNEVQAMREEIAELRDMIERQQFELRKLKSAQQAPSNNPAAANPNYPSAGYSASGGGVGQTVSVPAATNTVQQSTRVLGAYPSTAQSIPSEPVNQLPQASSNATGSVPQTEGGFYRPYTDQADVPRSVSANSGAPVSSTVITAPPVASQQDTGYPPVVDRSVGSSAVPATVTQQSNTNSYQPPASNSQQVYLPANTPQGNPAQLPASQQVLEAVQQGQANQPAQNGRVVAVPPANVPAGNQASINNQTGLPAPTQTIEPQQSSQTAFEPQQTASQSPLTASQPQQSAPQSQPVVPVLAETDFYSQGFNLLKQSQHAEAVRVFEQQIDAYPQGEYADDAYYWIAESMYVNRKLDQSKKNFKAIIDNFKQSPRLPDAMLKTAYIEQDQGNRIEAQLLLQEILQFHPRSNAAISAKNRLAEMKN